MAVFLLPARNLILLYFLAASISYKNHCNFGELATFLQYFCLYFAEHAQNGFYEFPIKIIQFREPYFFVESDILAI